MTIAATGQKVSVSLVGVKQPQTGGNPGGGRSRQAQERLRAGSLVRALLTSPQKLKPQKWLPGNQAKNRAREPNSSFAPCRVLPANTVYIIF